MEKEIEVGNKDADLLIHEFMHPPNGEKMFIPRGFVALIPIYSTWERLMPVVQKIGDTRLKATAIYNPDLMFKVEICTGYTKIEGTHQVIFHNASKDGMLTATYKAVIDFINWYNEQNK